MSKYSEKLLYGKMDRKGIRAVLGFHFWKVVEGCRSQNNVMEKKSCRSRGEDQFPQHDGKEDKQVPSARR